MKKYTNSVIGAILSFGIIVFLASCLNPIGFDPTAIQIKVSAEVSGEIDVRSSDYAILWVINRTRSVDVTNLTISQEGAEGYPKIVAKPGHASTYASYHRPTDKPYRIDITFAHNPEDNTYPAEKSSGSFSIAEKYMPKAGGNYVVYLYRAQDGQLVVVEDELITKPLDPGDTENPTEPPAAGTERYPLIVRNVTADADASYIDFALNSTTLTYEGPNAKDEYLNYLAAGQYQVTAGLYKKSDASQENLITTPVKNLPIIKPNDSQSWHTLYLWIYKTKSGGYGTTTTWPPNPNDAADVSISDVAGEGNGLLKIINKSESGDVIKSILLDSGPIAFGGDSANPSFIKDMEWTTVLSPGLHTVAFMPSRQTFHGITLSVQINEGEVTTLSYYDRLSDPDLPPPDEGNGSGLIKVINNSTGVVNRVIIRDTNDSSRMTSYNYEQFTPPSPVNYNQTGRIGVVGDADFPITAGAHYLIQVDLILPDDHVAIERLAALKDQVVEIVINAEEISKVHGADITLVNATSVKPVQITGVTLFNKADRSQASSFSGLNWNPNGYVGPNRSAGFRANSSVGMPITESRVFEAEVAIFGNGQLAVVTKPVGSLYDTSHTITIADGDVPPELVETFEPVTDITGIPSTLTSYIDLANPDKTVMGTLNLNGAAVVVPSDATVKGPITWEVYSGSGATISDDNILTVTTVYNIPSNGSITIKATIAGAKGAVSNRQDYTQNFPIILEYVETAPPNIPVERIDVDSGGLSLLVGEHKSLNAKVTIYPSDASIGGHQITVADLDWSIQSGDTFVSLVNSSGQNENPKNYAKGIAAGNAQVMATLPNDKNGGYGPVSNTVTVNVTQPRPAAKTVRLISSGGGDTLEGLIFVSLADNPVSMPTNSQHWGYYGTTAYGSSTVPLWQTGQTRVGWPSNANQITNWSKFWNSITNPKYYTLGLKANSGSSGDWQYVGTIYEKYRDIIITLDQNNSAKNQYLVFVDESGGRVRGTTYGEFDPLKTTNNFYFYLDLEKLPTVTRNGAEVVPIFYDSHWNTTSIGIRFPYTDSSNGATNRKYPPMKPDKHTYYSNFNAQ